MTVPALLAQYLHICPDVKTVVKIFIFLPLLCASVLLHAQQENYDVFNSIGKYIVKGDADCLSAWFDESVDISVSSRQGSTSKAQARQIIKSFFSNHTPQSFNITHLAEKADMKYALGSLSAGGELFSVTIFVRSKGEEYRIQQLKIERL